MALVSPPNWLQAGTYTAQADRVNQQAVFNSTGVIGVGSLAVTAQGSPNMTVNIAAGWGAILSSTALQGAYGIYNDATVVQTISTADATNPRIDLIVATVNDAAISGALNNVVFTTVAGTPAGSPVAPSVPSNSLVLAQIAVAAATTTITTANITDRRLPVQNALLNANYYSNSANSATIASPTTTAQNVWTGATFALAANTTYELSGVFYFQFVAGTNTNATFQLTSSGSTTSRIKYDSIYGTATSGTPFVTWLSTLGTAVSATSTTTNGVTYSVAIEVKGFFRTTSTGNLTPQVAFASVTGVSSLIGLANSYLKLTPVGGANFTSVGAWS